MSKSGVLTALASGPKTTAELFAVTGTSPGDIARTCHELRKAGKVKRIDGASGRGARAIYALGLEEYSEKPGYLPASRRCPTGHALRPDLSPPAPGPARDPCFKCGVRGDIGCSHRSAAHG